VILLPAVIVLRNRDAAVATPLVLRGAVMVAVVEFASATLVTTVGASSLEAWAAISVVSAVATIAGWALIARGLAALLPQEPRPVVAGAANVVLWLLVADALSRLVELFSGPAVDYGIPGADLLTRVASVAGILTSIGWAVVARAIVRGTGYAPDLALRVARVAFAAYAVLIALDLVLRIGALVARALGPASVPFGYSLVAAVPVMSSGWLVPALATCLVVAAFGLGLADPAPRPRRVAPDDPVAPEPPEPAWPTAPQEYLPIHGGGRD
jgi:hypothetical protein